ncbi:type II toxin-antitoxin system HigB family toxin [Pantoea sp. 18069]|uniref:type II toxin-antitoxin system HigB family toxin n=1 Tax=Pantoea sp. 18069 TaxID=2681415 RepID=UPI00135933DA|nr:type II toxin-antitoxin system HigB family toxin [Pantoea sp. 18069]
MVLFCPLLQWHHYRPISRTIPASGCRPHSRTAESCKGNDYRLAVAVAYKMEYVFIKFVGTHKQYDAVDAATVGPLCRSRVRTCCAKT